MAVDPYKYFRVEAAEIHAELGQGVLDLERGATGADLVQRLLRQAHTLKGAARVVKQREIADHAHALEDLLAPFRGAPSRASRAQIDQLLSHLDSIGRLVAALNPIAQPEAAKQAARTAAIDVRMVRTDVTEVNAVLEGLGEAHIQLDTVRRSRDGLEHARHLTDILANQLSSRQMRDLVRPEGAIAFSKTLAVAHELRRFIQRLEQDLSSGVDQLDQELRQVREVAEHIRLLPAGALFTSLERAARDVAQAQGKSVLFEGRGGDIRIDAHVLGAVQSALLQLVRNAVAHGIERETDRVVAGKAPQGSVTLEVSRRGRTVAFVCRDDGCGVDREAVERASRKKGASEESVRTATLTNLLLHGGVSTAGAVTEISGRGIGLDVLRDAAQSLGGTVSFETERGKGTTVQLTVPLSLASIQVLLVISGTTKVGIPLERIRETRIVSSSDIAETDKGETLTIGGDVMPLTSLSQMLSPNSVEMPPPAKAIVIVNSAKGPIAIKVDQLLETAIVIQRQLPPLAPASSIVAGVSIDAAGNPQLVLDADGLGEIASRGNTLPSKPSRRRHRILVIDDSMTTRMLEQSILESAGYDVDTAASAEEGLEKARMARYDLFLVDVEMPGMDGFSFVERTRADVELRTCPAILVTSRAAPQDLKRGEEVGAKGYIVKGEFDQNALLSNIRKLVS